MVLTAKAVAVLSEARSLASLVTCGKSSQVVRTLCWAETTLCHNHSLIVLSEETFWRREIYVCQFGLDYWNICFFAFVFQSKNRWYERRAGFTLTQVLDWCRVTCVCCHPLTIVVVMTAAKSRYSLNLQDQSPPSILLSVTTPFTLCGLGQWYCIQ